MSKRIKIFGYIFTTVIICLIFLYRNYSRTSYNTQRWISNDGVIIELKKGNISLLTIDDTVSRYKYARKYDSLLFYDEDNFLYAGFKILKINKEELFLTHEKDTLLFYSRQL